MTETADKKLRDCPFCGGEPKRLNDGQGMSVFQCQKCTACHIRTFNNEAAFERWNTRHPDPRQQEKIEALRLDVSLLARLAEDWHENSDAAKVVKRIQAALAEAK